MKARTITAETLQQYVGALQEVKSLTNKPTPIATNKWSVERKLPNAFFSVLVEKLKVLKAEPTTGNMKSYSWVGNNAVTGDLAMAAITEVRAIMANQKRASASRSNGTTDIVKTKSSIAKASKPVKSTVQPITQTNVEETPQLKPQTVLFTAAHFQVFNAINFDEPTDVIIDGNGSLLAIVCIDFKVKGDTILLKAYIPNAQPSSVSTKLIAVFSMELQGIAIGLSSVEEAKKHGCYTITTHQL
jgi:hypothetical protein